MQPEARAWFVDRCLGKRTLAALRSLGATAEWLGDHFSDDALDEEWIPSVAARGWAILTKDKNIRRDSNQRDIVKTSGAFYVCLGAGSATADEQIARITDSWRTIVGIVGVASPPLILTITKNDVARYDFETCEFKRVKRKPTRAGR
ncbi:MAG: hypothetical protein M3Y87_10525 [Myxococcota bacterium]|nr:hypothetical protein [Myxococcota bacterium]